MGICGQSDSKGISNAPQAHHIVPGGLNLTRPRIALAQKKLTDPPVCIGINDAINGVFLPQSSKTSSNPSPGRTFHNCTFRDDYYDFIADQIAMVKADRMAVWAKLLELRDKLINGDKWPGLNLDPTKTMKSCAK
jgi:hypothetical protein